MQKPADTAEGRRLADNDQRRKAHWNRWGPFLSARAWGTVREDYSPDGTAWDYFPHDHARSRAYRWSEDGLAGHQRSPSARLLRPGALERERPDPEGAALRPDQLRGQPRRGRQGVLVLSRLDAHALLPEVPLQVPAGGVPLRAPARGEPAPARSRSRNSSCSTPASSTAAGISTFSSSTPRRAPRTSWSRSRSRTGDRRRRRWTCSRPSGSATPGAGTGARPPALWRLSRETTAVRSSSSRSRISESGISTAAPGAELLFTENDTNTERVFGAPNPTPVRQGRVSRARRPRQRDAVNPDRRGTKAAAWLPPHDRPPGRSASVRLRLTDDPGRAGDPLGADFDRILGERKARSGRVLRGRHPGPSFGRREERHAAGLRRACSGPSSSTSYDVRRWLKGDPAQPPPPAERLEGATATGSTSTTPTSSRCRTRGSSRGSPPGIWRFTAWSWLCRRPIRQGPARADAARVVHAPERPDPGVRVGLRRREPSRARLGGHPGLPDREGEDGRWATGCSWSACSTSCCSTSTGGSTARTSSATTSSRAASWGSTTSASSTATRSCRTGWILGQADGTSWMAMYCLNLLGMALELAAEDPVYEDVASKFWEHFVYIAHAVQRPDEPEGAGCGTSRTDSSTTTLRHPDGRQFPIRTRSLVGLLPLTAVVTGDSALIDRFPSFKRRMEWFLAYRPDLTDSCASMTQHGEHERILLSVVKPEQLTRVLRYVLDESEFLSPHGIRSVSQFHRDHPYTLRTRAMDYRLDYEPGESRTHLFGGNSNWRGPIWFPINYLILESLKRYHMYFGDSFRIECPVGSGNDDEPPRGLPGARAPALADLPARCRRPTPRLPAAYEVFQSDPHWKGPDPLPRVLPRGHRRRPRRLAPDRLDGPGREAPGREGRAALSVHGQRALRGGPARTREPGEVPQHPGERDEPGGQRDP